MSGTQNLVNNYTKYYLFINFLRAGRQKSQDKVVKDRSIDKETNKID